jgi:two-component system, NtrC family, sensor kinase
MWECGCSSRAHAIAQKEPFTRAASVWKMLYNVKEPPQSDSGIVMAAHSFDRQDQLRQICKTTRARWAVWIIRTVAGWEFSFSYGLSKNREAALQTFISQARTAAWLAGAFGSGRLRTRKTGEYSDSLNCQRVYIFPAGQETAGLFIGADQLEKISEGFLKIIALTPPIMEQDQAGQFNLNALPEAFPYMQSIGASLEVSYEPEGILANVLSFLAGSVPCDAALMSIRSGEVFRVEAVWNCSRQSLIEKLSLHDSNILAEMVLSRKGLILEADKPGSEGSTFMNFGSELSLKAKAWMGVPIVIGRRVIGLLAFISFQPEVFTEAVLIRISSQAGRLAYVVENAIVFTEAARYLQQFALLNELASAASLGVDTQEVADRVLKRLQRIFHSDRAGVYLLSPDGKTLREYGLREREEPLTVTYDDTPMGQVLKKGQPVRTKSGKSTQAQESESDSKPFSLSELVVPLKYRGKVIGALGIASAEQPAFTQQDEQLLVVIASHMAGLFENVRLNEETRQRAHNLNLIHQVVRKVVGLNDPLVIARIAAELMVTRFSYELASVILVDENVSALVFQTASGIETHQTSPDGKDVLSIGVSDLVLKEGLGRLINDVSREPGYQGLVNWQAGSEMCVPLKEGDHVLGVIDVERSRKNAFSENDLLALEALAGVLSSVVLSARRYRQLQDSVRQLQAVRETALDIALDLDFNALLKRVVHRARELVGVQGAELGLLDEKEQLIRILVSETPWYDSHGWTIPLMAGVAGKVAVFGEPLVVPDYNAWSGRLYPEKIAPFKAVAGIPLKLQGKVVGTLTLLDDRSDWSFLPEHIQLLELLAPQVTVWIRNARLYQELQERIIAQHTAENHLIRSARLAAVGEMAAGVAHELNNPLTTITGFVELILDELAHDSPHRPDLELVQREAHRARGVVRRLLDFSRPVESRRIRTGLNELLTDAVPLVHHLARTGGVEIQVELEENLPWVSVDPAQIKQVLLNLMHNAIQSMPTGGLMKIQTCLRKTSDAKESKEWASIAVRDNGEGISSEHLDRIFEPFFTTRPAGKGTGLGLSVSYGIVNDHGGFIEVESQLGQGSCFTILLPVGERESDL